MDDLVQAYPFGQNITGTKSSSVAHVILIAYTIMVRVAAEPPCQPERHNQQCKQTARIGDVVDRSSSHSRDAQYGRMGGGKLRTP